MTHSIAILTKGLLIHIVELLPLQLLLTFEAGEAFHVEKAVQGPHSWLGSRQGFPAEATKLCQWMRKGISRDENPSVLILLLSTEGTHQKLQPLLRVDAPCPSLVSGSTSPALLPPSLSDRNSPEVDLHWNLWVYAAGRGNIQSQRTDSLPLCP